jgi:hypothetical protein
LRRIGRRAGRPGFFIGVLDVLVSLLLHCVLIHCLGLSAIKI